MKRDIQPTTIAPPKQNRIVNDFLRDEDGATAIEYSLIVALIFLAVVASVRAFSDSTSGMYTSVSDTLSGN